jgi:hypothetical protein
MLVLLLAMSMGALAAANYIPTYCDECGAVLSEMGTNVGHYSVYHDAYTGLHDSQGGPVTDPCWVYHNITEIRKYCPNGHGNKWIGMWHTEDHSSSYCTDQQYWE